MKSEKVNFVNSKGYKLEGRLELPEHHEPVAYAIFAHCFTCTKNIRAATSICRALAAQKIATLRFDFTGLGESEGEFADSTFSSDTKDVVSAAEFLEANFVAPELLVGHSLGGTAVLYAAKEIPSIRGVVTIGAPFNPEYVTHHMECAIPEIAEKGEAEVLLANRPFTVKKAFLNDLKGRNPAKTIEELGKALLVMHSPIDQTVGIENASSIYSNARHPKSFVTLDPADHLLKREEDAIYAANVIASWASRYIKDPEKVESKLSQESNLVLARTGADSFRTELVANGHYLIADEPKSVGGTNSGPSPYDLLMASLAAVSYTHLTLPTNREV